RPAYEALRQHWTDRDGVNFAAALAAAEHATRLYPDRAEGWFHAFAYRTAIAAGTESDSAIGRYISRFETLHAQLSEVGDIAGSELRSMYLLARLSGDTAAATFWR